MPETPGSRLSNHVDHVDALHIGARLGEFEIVGLLGVGGFGMVYQAFDHSLLRFVAIKEYMPSALAGRSNGRSVWVRSSTDEPSFQIGLASFVDEARLLAQFDHPSLVKVFRFWEANQTAYMVMPLYSGLTLKQARVHMRTPPSEDWLRKVIWSVCSALRVLHNGKTLHRDISPDNIFLQDKGPPVLLDLGAARFAIGDRDQRHTAVLKVNYAPIEQYADSDSELKPGPWSDIYSLAAVIYGCICNDSPLPATLRSIRDRMVPFSRVARTVRKQFGVEYSAPFVDAISRALMLKPRDRQQSVDVFLEQMGLTSAPDDLESFDFRAALGENWINPAVQAISAVTLDLSEVAEPVAPPVSAAAAGRRNTDNVATVLHLPGSDSELRKAYEKAVAASGPDDFQDTVVRNPDFEDTRDESHEAFAAARVHASASAVTTASASAVAVATAAPKPAARPASGAAPVDSGKAGRSEKARSPQSPRKGLQAGAPRMLALSAALVLVLAGAAALYVSTMPESGSASAQTEQPGFVPTPEEEIVTEMAESASDSASAASEALALAASEAAAASAAVAVVKEPPKPRVAAVRKPAEASTPQELPPVVIAPAPAPQPAPVSSKPQVAKRVSPEDACADAGFLAKPMCVHNQCQQPGMESHPVCVEAKRKREEERRQRQNYSQ